jgi:ABC-2 type transport system ATP-binding protein
MKGMTMLQQDPIAIQLQGVGRSFGSVIALKDIDLEVPSGIVFGYLGPNGAGKTTTIRILLGLLDPTSGNARVLGFDTRTQADSIRLYSGALLEHSGLYERLSAADNLEFYGRVWRIPPAERKARVQELLTSLGLWERRKEIVNTWSRGMKQKLVVARTLLHRPRLVFLDEPTAGLDPVASAALRQDLENLARREGVTVFLTTHNLSEAEKLCDRVAVIRGGQLLMSGSPDELRLRQGGNRLEITGRNFNNAVLDTLRQHPLVSEIETHNSHLVIDLNGDSDTAPLVQILVAGGVQIDEVRRGKASLEEVFLELVKEENVDNQKLEKVK